MLSDPEKAGTKNMNWMLSFIEITRETGNITPHILKSL